MCSYMQKVKKIIEPLTEFYNALINQLFSGVQIGTVMYLMRIAIGTPVSPWGWVDLEIGSVYV